jgi:hypothetical protein
LDLDSTNRMEQHTTDRHVAPLEHSNTTSLYSLSYIYRWPLSLSLSLSLIKKYIILTKFLT